MTDKMMDMARPSKYGVVGGLGAVAGVDTLLKMIKATPRQQFDVAFEQHPFADSGLACSENYDPTRRKFYVYNMLKAMERSGVDVALVPCFVSHCFLAELAPELDLSVVSLIDALHACVTKNYPQVRSIGVLTSTFVKEARLFDRAFGDTWSVLYPEPEVQAQGLMSAVYGARGIRNGHHDGWCLDSLVSACENLIEQGAELILPGLTEIPVFIDALRVRVGVPIIDSNQAYAEYALFVGGARAAHKFKVGVVGGGWSSCDS